MGLLTLKQAHGLTATAMKTEAGANLERTIYGKLKYEVQNFFPNVSFPDAEDFSKKSYLELRVELLKDEYTGYATLMLGSFESLFTLTEGDVENFHQLDKDESNVISVLDKSDIYYIKNLALA